MDTINEAISIEADLLLKLKPLPEVEIFEFMKKHNILKNLVLKLEEKAMGKSDTIKKYEFVGLMLFVGIPLPGTGGWTGALIAALMGI